MHYRIWAVTILIGYLPQADAHGQSDHHYLFKTLTFREGLSHSLVTDIVQDSLGYLWLGTENGLNRYDGTEIVVFKHILDDTTSLLDNNIRKIFLDSQQRMWLLTASGVCQYQPADNRFKSYPHDAEADHGGLPLDIIENPEGQLLLLSHHNTLSVFSEHHDRFEKRFTLPTEATARSLCLFRGRLFVGAQRFLLEVDPLTGSVVDSYELFDDSYPLSSGITQLTVVNDQLWIAGTMMHMYRFDPVARTIEKIVDLPYITSLASLNPQVILAGSHEGVFLYHTTTQQVSPLRSVDYAPFLYKVNRVFVDRESNLWAASPQQGVIHTAGQRVFRDVRHLNEALVPYTNDISSLQTISNQQLWIGLNTGKVVAVDLQDQRYRMFYPDSVPALPPGTGTVFSISEDRQQRVWIGSYEGGLRHYEPSSGRFVLSNAAVDSLGIRSNDIRSIVEDQRGQLWLAVHGRGVDVYDPARKEVVASHGLSNGDTDPYISDWTFQLAIAPDSTVWIASASGLQMIKGTTKKYFQHHADQPGSLSNDKVTSLLRDARGHLWIGTAEGLNVLNPRDSSFTKFTTRQGLSDNYVSSLIEDASGHLWIGTYDGLSRLTYDTHPSKATIQRVEIPPGLYSNQFIDRASTMDTAGMLYLATTHGLLFFNPEDLPSANINLPVFLTDFKVFKQTPEGGEEERAATTLLNLPTLQDARQVRLKPHENTVSVSFSAIDFTHAGPIRYQYRLRGYDNHWSVSTERSITYHDLPAGEYTFEVKASVANAINVAPVESLSILIKKPWYRTAAGQVALALFLLAVMITGLYLLLERVRMKNQARLSEKEREIDQLKIKFFMNISHEFRTPLTLISGPLEKLITLVDRDDARQYLQLMHRNTKRLSRLVNQLLDLRQLEQQRYQLRVTKGELTGCVYEVYGSFRYLAEQRAIDYQFCDNTGDLGDTYFDDDVLDKILYNLLANAFKNTPDGGQIKVGIAAHPAQPGRVVIEVSDTGVGLAADQLDKIFERFYRVDATAHQGGTGIGLSLCQELAHLHQGEITVASTPNQGSTFALIIPVRAEVYAHHATELKPRKRNQPPLGDDTSSLVSYPREEAVSDPSSGADEDPRPIVLVADDNPDLLRFIRQSLATDFNVVVAQNGEEALQQALATVPDAVISDVMMPVMDGLHLAKKLKEDLRTSHIPVVLLTARATEQHQVAGLHLGVDDYITKPFSPEVLAAKLHSLIANRAKLRKLFTDADQPSLRQRVDKSSERTFLLRLTEIVDENMDNASLGTDDICREVGMSRSQLYRKLSAVTGQSVHEFVKLYRLTKAAELLTANDHTVTEIATFTGFKHVQTFTRSFKDHYGCTPSQYARSKVQSL